MSAPPSLPPLHPGLVGATLNRDWTDRLHPLLVKEVRQSLRSRWFERVFLALNGGLMTLMLLNVVLTSTPAFDFFFWAIILLTLHGLVPLRTALAAEEDAVPGNLDLIRITGISHEELAGQRLWALLPQALILSCSILPFLLLRYFMHGCEIVDDLQYLALLVLSAPVIGGLLLWMSLSGGCARLLLATVTFFLLPLYEALVANTAYATNGESAFLLFLLWLLVSFIARQFMQAMVSDAFLRGRS